MDDSWLGSTLSVCPMKKRCLLDATSMSTTREWQGYTTLSSSGPNSTCQTRESIMDGRSHAYTKSHMASSSWSLAYRHTCTCLCIPTWPVVCPPNPMTLCSLRMGSGSRLWWEEEESQGQKMFKLKMQPSHLKLSLLWPRALQNDASLWHGLSHL